MRSSHSLATSLTSSRRVVARLAATVHLFYYLTCAPNSGLKIAEYFTQSTFLGLHDRFNVAFGTLSFASLPHWAEGTSDGTKLVSLGCESSLPRYPGCAADAGG